MSVYSEFGMQTCVTANDPAGFEPGKSYLPLHWSRVG